MKDELKILREWIDRYNLNEIRESSTNAIRSGMFNKKLMNQNILSQFSIGEN